MKPFRKWFAKYLWKVEDLLIMDNDDGIESFQIIRNDDYYQL